MRLPRLLLPFGLLSATLLVGGCSTSLAPKFLKKGGKTPVPISKPTSVPITSAVPTVKKTKAKPNWFKREKVPYQPEATEPDDEIIFVDSVDADRLAAEGKRLSVLDGYAAEVDGQLVTIADVKGMASLFNRSIPRDSSKEDIMRKTYANLVKARGRLIKDELIIAEFRANGGVIPDQAIRSRMEEIIIDKFDGDQGALLKSMAEDGLSMEEFEAQIRRSITVSAMRQENMRRPGISPGLVRKSYEQRKDEFKYEEGVQLNLILVKGDSATDAKALGKVRQIRERVQGGESFKMLAKLYSEGPNAKEGGAMERSTRGDLSPILLNAISGLKAGEVSDVIDFDGSYALVEIEENNETAGYTPFEEVREMLEADEMSREARVMEDRWIRKLRERFSVVIFR